MSEKLFSKRRWTDVPKAVSIGESKSTTTEKNKSDEDFTTILRNQGVIKDNEKIVEGKVVFIKDRD